MKEKYPNEASAWAFVITLNVICLLVVLVIFVHTFYWFNKETTQHVNKVTDTIETVLLTEPVNEYDLLINERHDSLPSSIPDNILQRCVVTRASDKETIYSVRLTKPVIEGWLLPNITYKMNVEIKPVPVM